MRVHPWHYVCRKKMAIAKDAAATGIKLEFTESPTKPVTSAAADLAADFVVVNGTATTAGPQSTQVGACKTICLSFACSFALL